MNEAVDFAPSAKKFTYIVVSDIHLGHPKNPTARIVDNLRHAFDEFSDKGPCAAVDAIFLAGDLFDRLLNFASPEAMDACVWIAQLMSYCERNGIILRFLEGTPSHDWRQPRIAQTFHRSFYPKLDFKYIDTVCVEFLESFGRHILYIPDEHDPDPLVTYACAKRALSDGGVDKADLAIMHGMFAYQLPYDKATCSKHDEKSYLDMVSGLIHIGHIHTHSSFDRIVAQGSFDRMAHGEEESKGMVRATLGTTGLNWQFLENPHALIFKTVEVKKKMSLDQALEHMDKVLESVPSGSYVRLRAPKAHSIHQAYETVKLRYLQYVFSKQTEEDEKLKLQPHQSLTDIVYTPIVLDAKTIVSRIMQRVCETHSLDESQTSELQSLLDKVRP